MQNEKTRELFAQLKEVFGTYRAAADALGIPYRTLTDWRKRGFATEKKWRKAISHIQAILRNSNALSSDTAH